MTQEWNHEQLRADFPILSTKVNGHDLVYLDSAATAQKPRVLTAAFTKLLEKEYSSVHRGNHHLTELATANFENSRIRVAKFLNVKDPSEVIFTKGTTESINLLAYSLCEGLQAGDEIILSELEHHANIVPWQLAALRKKLSIKVIPVLKDSGQLDLEEYKKLLSDKTKIVSVAHISNVLGIENPVAEITKQAHDAGALVHIDGAQGIVHSKVDLAKLGCDFYSFSAHKLYGPTGVGVLWGRKALLEFMPPYQGGGNMIHLVSFEGTTFNDLPHKFEAGTPNITGVICFAEVLDYLDNLGEDQCHRHLEGLSDYFKKAAADFPDFNLLADATNQAGVYSFYLKGIHAQDVGILLNEKGIAVRVGHHCAQPLLKKYELTACARASLAIYNNTSDIDKFFEGLRYVQSMF